MSVDPEFFLVPLTPVVGISVAAAFIAAVYVLAVVLPRLKRILNASRAVKNRDDDGELPPVSVVVCSHADSGRLRQLLADILDQDYNAPFEIVVVSGV